MNESTTSELLAQMSWARALARDLVRDWDRAEELVQEVWVKALQDPPQRRNSVKGWISRVMRNRVYEERRNAARRRELAPPHAEVEVETPAETLERLETVQLLGELVRKLPQPFQAALLLRYFENCSLEEVARRQGVTVAAAETRVRRARDLIETQLRARPDADRRRHGLLLLAAPTLAPGGSLLLTVSIGVLMVAFLFAPFVWRMPWLAGSAQAPEPGATSPTHGTTQAYLEAPIGSGSGTLLSGSSRAEAAAERVAEVLVHDVESFRAVSGLAVRVAVHDAEGKLLDEQEWISDADRSRQLALAEEAVNLTWSVAPSATHTDGGGMIVHLLSAHSHRQQIVLPVRPLLGKLRGRVVDASGLPVPHASVGVWFGGNEDRGEPPTRTVAVQPDGSFELPAAFARGIPAFVAPMATGFSALRCFTVHPLRELEPLVEGVELALEPGRVHLVRVLSTDGTPLPQVEVELRSGSNDTRPRAMQAGTWSGRRSHRLSTDLRGETTSIAVGTTPWQLRVGGSGYVPWQGECASDASVTVVTLSPAHRLSGTVLTPQRAPARAVRVIAEAMGGSTETWTDSEGRFVLAHPGTPGETLRLVCLPADDSLAMAITEVFIPEPQGGLQPLVLSAGLTLSAELLGLDGERWPDPSGIEVHVGGGRSSLPPGGSRSEDWLVTRDRYYPERGWSVVAGTHIELHGLPADALSISFWSDRGPLAEAVLQPGQPYAGIRAATYPNPRASLELSVRRAGSELRPTATLRVRCLRLVDGDPFAPDGTVLEVDAACANGACEIVGLEPGRWNVEVFDRLDSSLWSTQSVELSAGTRSFLAPVLDDSYGGLLQLLHVNGEPAAWARVELIHYDDRRQAVAPGTLSAIADADGTVALSRLPLTQALRLVVTTRDGTVWKLPEGSLDPRLGSWRLTLPE